MCDFSTGFKKPELVKKRPVIVIASVRQRSDLATVVGLSTTEPYPIEKYHCEIESKRLPKNSLFQNKRTWIKGDMIYRVGFHRLSLIGIGRVNGRRNYYYNCFGKEYMAEVYKCVLHGLDLGDLTPHL